MTIISFELVRNEMAAGRMKRLLTFIRISNIMRNFYRLLDFIVLLGGRLPSIYSPFRVRRAVYNDVVNLNSN